MRQDRRRKFIGLAVEDAALHESVTVTLTENYWTQQNQPAFVLLLKIILL